MSTLNASIAGAGSQLSWQPPLRGVVVDVEERAVFVVIGGDNDVVTTELVPPWPVTVTVTVTKTACAVTVTKTVCSVPVVAAASADV